MKLQSISSLIFFAGLIILINSTTWPFKVAGSACLIIGFILITNFSDILKSNRSLQHIG